MAAPAADRAERLALAVGEIGERLVVAGLDQLRVVELVAADRLAGRAERAVGLEPRLRDSRDSCGALAKLVAWPSRPSIA